MNRFAYRTTGLAIKTIYNLSKADMILHGQENIPLNGSIIFVINHFTRIETFLMPYLIAKLTNRAVWSLADESLFGGTLGEFLDSVGAVSTKDPQRDQLIVKTLLTGEAHWIIFPEGRMVKSQKIIEKGRYIVSYAGGKHPPHTGAATLALRTEFYRRRLLELEKQDLAETDRLLGEFKIPAMENIHRAPTCIVPVNITYYPIRARENILSKLATTLVGRDIPDRVVEEIMTEGAMLLSGVDIDIRFGPPIDISDYMQCNTIAQDICNKGSFGFDAPIASRKQMRRDALRIMQRYLDAIYNMTTVNSDHLFAAMVRQMPYRKTNEADLKRRVFLIASAVSRHHAIHLHRNLKDNQLHLLTDDRFHRFRDFMSVAIGKGVLIRKNGDLIRETTTLSSPFDFHRVRIDNPIAVMANAIEPLRALQKSIRQVAWMPGFLVRRKVVKALLKMEMAAFEADYAAFFSEAESKGKNIGRPYLIPGKWRWKSQRTGVLLIHGYLAAPAEVRELAIHLAQEGYPVYAPRLKGHGTSPEDLALRTYQDWIKSIDAGYAIIRSSCSRVIVGGFSTGAGLALDLAARVSDIHGVFAVCLPMRLQDLSAKFVPAVAAWNRLMQKFQVNGGQKEFVDNHPEHPHINYHRNPISGVRELERLMRALEPKLAGIKAPALIVQADRDPVVDPRGSRSVFEQLGATTKTYSLLNFSRHGILLGEGAEKVHRVISSFIEQL
jgi:esterase/lipase/1-acyl-sn-glycerol-3-phosphate acyltransferase